MEHVAAKRKYSFPADVTCINSSTVENLITSAVQKMPFLITEQTSYHMDVNDNLRR